MSFETETKSNSNRNFVIRSNLHQGSFISEMELTSLKCLF